MQFEERVILITGASRGLGRALALEFADTGAKLALVARHAEALAEVAGEVQRRGGRAAAFPYDIADKHAIYALVGAVAATFGPIDVLINNASTLGPWGEATPRPLPLLLDTDCEALEAVLQTNLVGPFRLSKAVLGHMLLQGEGTLVNISSDAALAPYPGWGAYGTSKAALDHLTRIWSEELSDTGVRLISIDPGEMDTVMHRAALPDADPKTLARPEAVACRIFALLTRGNFSNGSRVLAAEVQ